MPDGHSELDPHVVSSGVRLDPDLHVNKCSRAQLAGHPPLDGRSNDPDVSAVQGLHCTRGIGVDGLSLEGTGVHGDGAQAGVMGQSQDGTGLVGQSQTGRGVFATSRRGEAIRGETNARQLAAVVGVALNPNRGPNDEFSSGVWGSSKAGEGVHGESNSDLFAAVAGIQINPNSTGAGVYGEHRGNGPAGFFNGNVVVTKDIFLSNADCAEDFDLARADAIEPGTVVVLDQEGAVLQSERAYDRKVAGIVSGAGELRPAIVLDKRQGQRRRVPIALVGKAYCKADATYGPIDVGDLLTTSPTPGHAMRAEDPVKAFGAVIGKALRPLRDGTGLIPVLVALQ
jgi:hypothetical protein